MEEVMSFLKVETALLENLSKKTESETIREAVNVSHRGGDVKEFFDKASKLYKVARFNKCTKQGMKIEAIQSDLGLLHFVLLRKAKTFDEVEEACLE